jgi:hypothetical protein
MLYELFTSLTTPCPQYVRHMYYLYEVIAMRSRHRRNRAAWQPHLDNTRRFVLAAAERCQHRSKAVILGSGLLLDVPLEELSSMFREVVLLDIVFLPEVRRKTRQCGNVKLIQHDVTNMAKRLHESIQCGRPELPAAAPAVPELDGNTGLVVSLNVLSQLWVMPRAYALRKLRGLDEEQVDDWCRQIVESHYAFLLTLPCTVGLVADMEFVKRDRKGAIISQGSTIAGLTLPKPDASWTWNILPLSENRQYLSKELNVGAWHVRVEPPPAGAGGCQGAG